MLATLFRALCPICLAWFVSVDPDAVCPDCAAVTTPEGVR